jgi:hypothetical protein
MHEQVSLMMRLERDGDGGEKTSMKEKEQLKKKKKKAAEVRCN